MSKYSSKDVILLIDGYNVLGQMTELTDAKEAITEDVTGFSDAWEQHEYVGVQRYELSQNGFFNDAALSVNAAFNEKQGDSRVVCFGYEGNTAGKAFVGLGGAIETRFERIATQKNLHKANIQYICDGESSDGDILLALTAKTADGDTEAASIDNGAESTGGAYVFLQVTALDLGGYDNIVVTVRSSTNDSDWANLQAFTAVTAAPAAQRILKTGTIPRYLAVSWAFTGTGSDPSATIFVGAARL